MQVNAKDIASGTILIIVGLAYFWMAWTGLPIGSALEMGPGYFPVILSSILVILGTIIAIRAFLTAQQTEFGRVPWRGVIMLSMGTLVFAALFEGLGLLPGVFVLSLLSSLSTSQTTPFWAVAISLFLSIFCTIVFGYGIGLPIPIIGPFFNFLGDGHGFF